MYSAAFLPIALGYFLAGQIGGPVYAYCKQTLGAPQVMWFIFAAIGLVAAAGMLLLARGKEPKSAAPASQ